MILAEFTAKLKALFSQSCSAEASFGKSSSLNGVTVIPVAKVVMGFGGGEGKSGQGKKGKKQEVKVEVQTGEGTSKEEEHGLGFGGGSTTTPLGIFTIQDGRVRFHPVITFEKVLGISLLVFMLLFGLRKKSRKR